MHHLHPRSRTTSTLFTTTLAVSFLVVALPHILPPCPVDRRQFADSGALDADGQPIQRRRRRRRDEENSLNGGDTGSDRTTEADDDSMIARRKRECPVPKPSGLVGQMMGFEQKGEKEKPVQVVVKSLRDMSNVRREELDAGSMDRPK